MRGSATGRVIVVAIALALLGAATADAATLVIASKNGGRFRSVALAADSTNVPLSWPGGASAASPVDGTVVTWSTGTGTGVYRLRIVRQVMPGIFQGVGSSDPASAGAPVQGFPPPFINPTVSIPIQAGDLIGLEARAGDRVLMTDSPGTSSVSFAPPLADGASSAPTGSSGSAAMVTASVRYCEVPSVRGKTLKKAKKLLVAADCKPGKVRRAKSTSGGKLKVRRQKPAPGAQVSDTAPIRLTLG